jgi:hypothetical protein
MEIKYPNIKVKLVGRDGNAFAIMGNVSRALRQNGAPKAEIDECVAEMTSGDYNNLLQTAMKRVKCY